ncbi:MAG: VacJ family lipoprotein [Rubrivivax sp.]
MKRAAAALATAALLLAGGCASVPPGAQAVNPVDPWEAFNRKVFAFNETLDEAVLRPVAQAYRDHVPQLVRTGVSNFFGNLGDVWSTANHFLQGKIGTGFEMGMRVLSNTLFGLGGILDPATEFRLPRRSEDLGQTLGVWGLPAGPYIVLPVFGPSSLRDTVGLPFDRYAGSTSPYFDVNAWATSALQLVNVRAELLATTQLLSDVSLDKYSFLRDAYLARRRDQVYDGAPPLEKFEDEGADDPEPAAPPKKGS